MSCPRNLFQSSICDISDYYNSYFKYLHTYLHKEVWMRYEVLKYSYNCVQLKLAKIYRPYILQTAICSTSEDTEKQAVNSNRKKKKEDTNDILCKSTSTDFQEHLPLL